MKRRKKSIWHDVKLMIITILALIACPTTFYLAIAKDSAVYLAICILCGMWLFLFQLANGNVCGRE